MTSYRTSLPQLRDGLFLTDGGIETSMIFQEGKDLPCNAAFVLLGDDAGRAALRTYFANHTAMAERYNTGFILESATWRANPDWAAKIGYSREALAAMNRDSIRFLEEIRNQLRLSGPAVISGCVGPRGDGYSPDHLMSESEAEAYHREQIDVFARTAADMVSGMTLNYTEEAIGVVRASQRAGMPVAVSFTVETDGCLPTGESLKSAIERVDASTESYAAYFMINCAHPSHFEHVLKDDERWTRRIRGLRANASRLSHVELEQLTELDIGNPAELGQDYARIRRRFPQINVLGGCCGTDHRHVEQIAAACAPLFATA